VRVVIELLAANLYRTPCHAISENSALNGVGGRAESEPWPLTSAPRAMIIPVTNCVHRGRGHRGEGQTGCDQRTTRRLRS
jgi:hypothetical protein